MEETPQNEMAQVDVMFPASVPAGIDEVFLTPLHTSYAPSPIWSPSAAVPIQGKSLVLSDTEGLGASSLPTPPPEREFNGVFRQGPLASPSGPVQVAGLPPVSSGRPNELIQSRLLQAALDAEMDEPNAEKAFFVADLSAVYQQYARWVQLLPEIEPFYGESFDSYAFLGRGRLRQLL